MAKTKRSSNNLISTIVDGIEEVKRMVLEGIIQNPENQRYYNIPHESE